MPNTPPHVCSILEGDHVAGGTCMPFNAPHVQYPPVIMSVGEDVHACPILPNPMYALNCRSSCRWGKTCQPWRASPQNGAWRSWWTPSGEEAASHCGWMWARTRPWPRSRLHALYPLPYTTLAEIQAACPIPPPYTTLAEFQAALCLLFLAYTPSPPVLPPRLYSLLYSIPSSPILPPHITTTSPLLRPFLYSVLSYTLFSPILPRLLYSSMFAPMHRFPPLLPPFLYSLRCSTSSS